MNWYDHNQRDLPWRAKSFETANPYHVYLSEIMLQQTTVSTVKDYFSKFIQLWPTVNDLAKADLDDVLHAWQGLGYYSRARNLYKCATLLSVHFPNQWSELIKLPGIGDYTAKAIGAIAFNENCVPVDGNVIRVFARYFGITEPLPILKKYIDEKANAFNILNRSGDFAQSLMDLGSMICRPKSALCHLCPLSEQCVAYKQNIVAGLPHRLPKMKLPQRYGYVFIYRRQHKGGMEYLIERRPEKGLLGGLYAFPTTAWIDDDFPKPDYTSIGTITHTFTHFKLHLKLVLCDDLPPSDLEGLWVTPDALHHQYALPTLMRKVLKRYELVL